MAVNAVDIVTLRLVVYFPQLAIDIQRRKQDKEYMRVSAIVVMPQNEPPFETCIRQVRRKQLCVGTEQKREDAYL